MTDSKNQNVDEFGVPFNEEMGQVNESIGQDERADTREKSNSDWESQAKYFQSEKDKLHVENQKLKQYAEVGKFLESRPDIVESIKTQATSGQPDTQQPQGIKKPDEFDPWEAYNDPASASYKYRMQEMESTVNNAVGSAVSQATQGIRQETGRTKLESQLSSQGMTNEEIGNFMEFADKHPSEYGLENVIKMWRAVSQAPVQSRNDNPLDQVRNVQSQPQPTGVLAGERPKGPKSDEDSMWDNIVKAGSRNNVL
jgi:hypothetical protein